MGLTLGGRALSAPIRFALEAALLIAVALALVAVDLRLLPFVLFMSAAWAIVAAVEHFASRPAAPRSSAAAPLQFDQERERRRAGSTVAAKPEERDTAAPREPDAAREPDLDGSRPAETVAAEPARAAEPEPARKLGAVPPPEPESVPEPEEEAPPEQVVELPQVVQRRPDGWNLWELEQHARERAGEDPLRDEEWNALIVSLRDFASPDGTLPAQFDELVRESFGELISDRRL